MALAFKMRGEPRVAMTYFGEGSTANGQWHEAMNFAGIHRLPVVFVLENNRFAYSTPNELEFAVDPVERAETYGFPGVQRRRQRRRGRVRGVARVAAERARAGEGPTLIECQTMRMHGHGAHDDMSYVPDGDARGVVAARPDRALRRAAGRRARLRRRRGRADPRRGQGLRRRVRAARRSPRRCPTRASRPSGVFADDCRPRSATATRRGRTGVGCGSSDEAAA